MQGFEKTFKDLGFKIVYKTKYYLKTLGNLNYKSESLKKFVIYEIICKDCNGSITANP